MSDTNKNKRYPENTLLRKNGSRTILPNRASGSGNHGSSRLNRVLAPAKSNPKDPPGILDWIIDKFLNPLKTAISDLLSPVIGHPTEGEYGQLETAVSAIREIMASGSPHSHGHSPPLTPDSEKTDLEDWAKTGFTNSQTAWILSIMAETASLGQVDISVGGYTGLPVTRAYYSLIEEVAKAEWLTGRMPYLTRYWLKEYTPLLPGYMDMIGIYVREGYLEDHQVELPSEFAEYMKELGYPDFWTKRLWGKHWVLPGVDHLYEMFHKKIIDYETMALMLKFHDFLPEWRDRLIQNAYELIPRVDLRRAYMYGVDGYEDLVEPYEKLGYSPEDAATMDQIAKRFALEAHYSRLLTVARAAYRKGQLPGPEFQAIMEGIHIPTAAQDLILQAETLARLTAVKDPGEEPYMPSRSDMRWMVEWGQISAEDLKDLAEADGIDPAWSPRVTEAWLLNQQRDELAKVRAVYERRLREGFMSKADFGKALSSLHYAGHVVDALERWADEELDLQERLEEAKEYEALAKDEVITPTEYGQALRDLGMTEERITRSQKHIERLLAIKAAKEEAKAKG